MLYRVACAYKDPAGSGIFYINKDDTVSWGIGKNNVILPEGPAQVLANSLNRRDVEKGYNKDGKNPWKLMEAPDAVL